MVSDALAATYTWGDPEIGLDDVTDFPTAPGGVVLLDDDVEWILVKYGTVDAPNDELETLAAPIAVRASVGGIGHTFQIGTVVKLTRTVDYINPIVSDIIGAPAGAVFFEDGDEIGSDANFTFDKVNDKLTVVSVAGAQLQLGYDATKYLRITVDTNHDVLFKPTSTGQIKFQATTDQTNFFQILDADGGAPVFNVDAVNERISIGTATPSFPLEIHKAGTVTLALQSTDDNVSVMLLGCAADPDAAGIGYDRAVSLLWLGAAGGVGALRDAFVVNANGSAAIGTTTFDGAAVKCLTIANGTEPAAHTDNQIYIYSKDSVGSVGATLGITMESPVVAHDAGGAWTLSHKWFVWLDGTEYSIPLDAL